MTNTLQFFVPSTVQVSMSADLSLVCAAQDAIKRNFAMNFGGYTAYQVNGGYVTTNGELVCEPILIVETYTDNNDIDGLWEHLRKLAYAMRILLSQDSVLIRVNGQTEFV